MRIPDVPYLTEKIPAPLKKGRNDCTCPFLPRGVAYRIAMKEKWEQ
jgi:hypothetical protein